MRLKSKKSAVEKLESRRLLSAGLSSLNGTWNDNAITQYGSIQFNGSGGIAGGSLHQYSGDVTNPSGTYTVASNGGITISAAGSNELIGAVNSTDDIASASESAGTGGYGVYVFDNGGAFNNASMAGVWTLISEGDTDASNGVGTLTFDSSGNITTGTLNTGAASNINVTGSYIISANGVVSLTLDASGTTLVMVGGMNDAQDFISQSPYDPTIGAAEEQGDPLIIELVRSSATYSDADVAGTWELNSNGFVGTAVTFDASGNITGGTGTLFTGTTSESVNISGTYSLSSSGAMILNSVLTPVGGGSPVDFDATGAMNTNKNAFAVNEIGATKTLDAADGIKLGVTPPFATLTNGDLVVTGTSGNDSISVTDSDGSVVATLNGTASSPFTASEITGGISITGGAGDDTITLTGTTVPATVHGNAGDDVIVGNGAGDSLTGNAGNDNIKGGAGNDTITGGAGDDTLKGAGGDDSLSGGAGNDVLKGNAGNNSLNGGAGTNALHGGIGNDTFYAEAGTNDEIFADTAVNDTLYYSASDAYVIETGVIPAQNQILVS